LQYQCRHTFAFPRRVFARVMHRRCPSMRRGRRECRVHAAPTALLAKRKKTQARSPQVRRNHSGTPCAMALRLLRALLGVPGLLAPVAREIVRELIPSIGGTGPHGLTVRIDTHRLRANTSTASRTNESWRSRAAPPGERGMARNIACPSEKRKRFIFTRTP
jgi:hypothetical protein